MGAQPLVGVPAGGVSPVDPRGRSGDVSVVPGGGPSVGIDPGDAPASRAPAPLRGGGRGPLVRGALAGRTAPAGRRVRFVRVVRYGATSVTAFGVSEATLLALYGGGLASATVAALVANLVATVPSYLMSRYWIWSEATRSRAGRQVLLYWAVSIASIAGTSFATGAIASLTPAGHPFHLVVVGAGFFVVSVGFWLAKFVVYQRVVFPVAQAGA